MNPRIQVSNLYKSYGPHEILRGVSLDFTEGKICTVLGPNASGKTTLIKSVLGMVIPDKGEIMVDGQNIKGTWKYKEDINYLPQIAEFPENLKVDELIAFIEKIRGSSQRKQELIDIFDLSHHLGETVSVLSGGTKQKVNLVLAFMYDNPIFILDEPTNGLDPVALVHLKELILQERDRGKCIVITTHIMQLVEELADEIVYLLEGHIHFRGNVQELLQKYDAKQVEKAIANLLTEDKESNTKQHVEGI